MSSSNNLTLTTFSLFSAKLKPSLRVTPFAGAALFCYRQVLFVFVHDDSEDGVVACTREILVFSRSFHSQQYVLLLNKLQEGNSTRKKFNSWKCLISKHAHTHSVLGPGTSIIKNRECPALSTLTVGRGNVPLFWSSIGIWNKICERKYKWEVIWASESLYFFLRKVIFCKLHQNYLMSWFLMLLFLIVRKTVVSPASD